ncbi:MAG TPA: hypothetical protein VMU46_06790 [Burkholderiales bacterium]|nr:hypothetical protein [Burkholderiales bacterium]
MPPQGEIFMPGEDVVFRGRAMRIAGRVQFEGASGQLTFRYLLSEPAGAPVILEEGDGRFALLRSFPPGALLRTAGNTITVGTEKYTLVGVRKLKVLDLSGKVPGIAANARLVLSGIFESPIGTLMREMVPGATSQTYYLLKPLAPGDVLSATRHAAEKDAAARAAGDRALDTD